jgi:hypothetical protein
MQQRSLQPVRVSVSLIFLIHGLIIATWASRKLARLVTGSRSVFTDDFQEEVPGYRTQVLLNAVTGTRPTISKYSLSFER